LPFLTGFDGRGQLGKIDLAKFVEVIKESQSYYPFLDAKGKRHPKLTTEI
jgi:hypothetical protein